LCLCERMHHAQRLSKVSEWDVQNGAGVVPGIGTYLAARERCTGKHSARQCLECPKCCLKILKALCSTSLQSIGVRPLHPGFVLLAQGKNNGAYGAYWSHGAYGRRLSKMRASGVQNGVLVQRRPSRTAFPDFPDFPGLSELPDYETRCAEWLSKVSECGVQYVQRPAFRRTWFKRRKLDKLGFTD
jgi:hypothetical protein